MKAYAPMHLDLSLSIVNPCLQALHRWAPLTGQPAPVSATPFLQVQLFAARSNHKRVQNLQVMIVRFVNMQKARTYGYTRFWHGSS